MRWVVWISGVAIAAVALYAAAIMIPASGRLTKLTPKLVDDCRRVDVFPGTEDVTIDPEFNAAFVSADDRRAAFAGRPSQGGIYGFNVDAPGLVVRVSVDAPADFHPHGVSIWQDEQGKRRLFAVNHSASGPTVEIFDLQADGMLKHLETVAFPEMRSPNDVLGVGPRQFYVTNDRGATSPIMQSIEAWFALPLASLAYYDGEQGSIAAKGLVYANGVNMARDGRTVYVAETLRRRIARFDRDPETGVLRRKGAFRVRTNPDNIEVAKDGGIWVAGHPNIFAFLKHVKDPRAVSPSEVIRINARTGESKNFFVDLSGALNASSVGAVWDKTLVVGSVFDGHVMVCPMVKIFLENAGGDAPK
jgi:arylesterase/paraoxonase